ncbi:MAG: cohesin domain-containing protein [Candidatus Paceibacterota bacterium]
MIKKINKRIETLFVILMSFLFFFLFASFSCATTEIYFQKDLKEITKGDTFLIDLKISSTKEINVIDGTIIYDKDKLAIKEVTTNNSLLSLWVKEPAFNNETGELSFTGGSPEGFHNRDGQILRITFLAKQAGSAFIGFKDIFSIFINDGKGTKINPWFKPLSLFINKKVNHFLKYIEVLIFIFIIFFIAFRLFLKFRNKKNEK